MTEKILCGKCNMLLYFGEEIKKAPIHARHTFGGNGSGLL